MRDRGLCICLTAYLAECRDQALSCRLLAATDAATNWSIVSEFDRPPNRPSSRILYKLFDRLLLEQSNALMLLRGPSCSQVAPDASSHGLSGSIVRPTRTRHRPTLCRRA